MQYGLLFILDRKITTKVGSRSFQVISQLLTHFYHRVFFRHTNLKVEVCYQFKLLVKVSDLIMDLLTPHRETANMTTPIKCAVSRIEFGFEDTFAFCASIFIHDLKITIGKCGIMMLVQGTGLVA